MDNIEISKKIQTVIDAFGMKDNVVAKAMGISVQTVRNNRSERATRHWFNEKNYNDLIAYIKKEVKKF